MGEQVVLTVSGGPATWSVVGGGGTLSPPDDTWNAVLFTAGENAATVVIRATTVAGCTCQIVLQVVEPQSWTMERKLGTHVQHPREGRPRCVWYADIFINPKDVNFSAVQVRELDSQYVGTGSYADSTGQYHGDYPAPERASLWFVYERHSERTGTNVKGADRIDTGDVLESVVGASPPFVVGAGYFPITWQWRVGETGAVRNFRLTRQEDEIFSNGRCESRKGGHMEYTMYNDPVVDRVL